MKGKITAYNGHLSTGEITGENGIKYFFHRSDCDRKKIKRGYLVNFKPINENKSHLKAINIKIIGIGYHHPFCSDLEKCINFIRTEVPDSQEKEWRLRDLNAIYNYFKEKEEMPGDKYRERYNK